MRRFDSRLDLGWSKFLKDKISFDILMYLNFTFLPDLGKDMQTSPEKLDLEAQNSIPAGSSSLCSRLRLNEGPHGSQPPVGTDPTSSSILCLINVSCSWFYAGTLAQAVRPLPSRRNSQSKDSGECDIWMLCSHCPWWLSAQINCNLQITQACLLSALCSPHSPCPSNSSWQGFQEQFPEV